MNEGKKELSFGEKVILVLYKKFFGEEYDGSDDAKVCVQNMCYLLSLMNFRIEGFYYTWNDPDCYLGKK